MKKSELKELIKECYRELNESKKRPGDKVNQPFTWDEIEFSCKKVGISESLIDKLYNIMGDL